MQSKYPTLREDVLADNWPTLAKARGRFLFAFEEPPAKVEVYRGARTSIEGWVVFLDTDDTRPREPALAQYISTNPLQLDQRIAGGCQVHLRNGAVARCNPVRRPAGRVDARLERGQ